MQVPCPLGEWTDVGSGTGERFLQTGSLCQSGSLNPIAVKNSFQILNEDEEEECAGVVEAGVSSSGAPVETTTLCEEHRKR